MTAIAVLAMVCGATLFAQKKDDKKKDDAQQKDLSTIAKLVDDIAAGTVQPANDVDLKLVRVDPFKAQGDKAFVPFVVTVDPSKVPAGAVNFYWRVVSKNPAAAAAPAAAKNDKKDKDKKQDKQSVDYPWEDYNAGVPLASGAAAPAPAMGAAAAPARIARSFSVVPGSYDIYVAVEEAASATQKGAPAPKVSVIKQPVEVPDFWNNELNTSAVVVSTKIIPLAAQLTPQQRQDRPYGAFGTLELVPTLDYKLLKSDEIHIFFLVYNPKTDENGKPSVTIEYNFYSKPAGAPEKFFNKTPPMALNASTLPPQFSVAAGHQLQGGQDVPLASFPVGDYRLEIKITDTLASKTITRDVNFSVNAS